MSAIGWWHLFTLRKDRDKGNKHLRVHTWRKRKSARVHTWPGGEGRGRRAGQLQNNFPVLERLVYSRSHRAIFEGEIRTNGWNLLACVFWKKEKNSLWSALSTSAAGCCGRQWCSRLWKHSGKNWLPFSYIFTVFLLLLFSAYIVSSSFWTHEPQHARLPCPSPPPEVFSDLCPLSRWCHPTISSSVTPFSSCPQSFPVSGSLPMSQFFASGGQSIGLITCKMLVKKQN